MEKVTKQVEVYSVYGKDFLDENDALEYEKTISHLMKHTYYTVSHGPDLTEGRKHYHSSVIAVPYGASYNALLHFLVDTFGKPLAFVQGVAPIENWVVHRDGYKFNDIEHLSNFIKSMKETNFIFIGVSGELIHEVNGAKIMEKR